MSGEIVNLNKARKAKAKADGKMRAAENRTKHGQTTAERARTLLTKLQAQRKLDGARRDGNDGDEGKR